MRYCSRAAASIAAACVAGGCSLGNISHDDCQSSAECARAFGFGSTCQQGFCSDPPPCASSADCRATFGYGTACVKSHCVFTPPDPRCAFTEPPELAGELASPIRDRTLIGGIFDLHSPSEQMRASAAAVAVSEINAGAQGLRGYELGLVACDSDSDGDPANDAQETEQLTNYLAQDVGVTAILGPGSSANAQTAINRIVESKLPTAVVTPSATSIALTNQPDRLAPSDPLGLLWRTCPSDADQAHVLVRIFEQPTPYASVAVVYEDDDYGQSLEGVVRDGFSGALRPFPFAPEPASSLDSRMQGIMAMIGPLAPDAILVVTSQAGRTVSALKAIAAQPMLAMTPVYMTDGSRDAATLFGDAAFPIIKDVLARSEGTAPGADPSTPEYAHFAMSLQTIGISASADPFLAHAYDAAYVVAYAIAYADAVVPKRFTGLDVVEGLSRLSAGNEVSVGPTAFPIGANALRSGSMSVDFRGASGPLDFDATTGEAPGTIEVWQPDVATKTFVSVFVGP